MMDYRQYWMDTKNVVDLDIAWNSDFMKEIREPAYRLVRKIPEKGTVLDAGSGSCQDYPFFINDGWKYTGLDPSAEMLAYSARLYIDAALCKDDIVTSKLSDNMFDLVYSASVICHLPPELVNTAIGNMMRISKKHLIIYTPYVHELPTAHETQDNYLRNRFNFFDLYQRIAAVGDILHISREDSVVAIHAIKRVMS